MGVEYSKLKVSTGHVVALQGSYYGVGDLLLQDNANSTSSVQKNNSPYQKLGGTNHYGYGGKV